MQNDSLHLWIDSSREHFKAYFMMSFTQMNCRSDEEIVVTTSSEMCMDDLDLCLTYNSASPKPALVYQLLNLNLCFRFSKCIYK